MSIEPQLISLLDRAVLKIEFLDTKGKAADIPEIEGLKIQYQGQSSQTQIVNFKTSSKVVHTYLVTPAKVGDFTIGPVRCQYNGGEKVLTAKLRVIKKADDPEAQQISEMMFSRISSERTAPYVHEPFQLMVDVYVRDGIQIDGNFSLRGGMPESGLEGELDWNVSRGRREEREGTIFNVFRLSTTVKTLTAGTFEFQPEVQVNVIVPRQKRRSYGFDDPFFGDFFGRQESRPYVLECNTLEMEVLGVPMEGRPDSFTGGVGEFNFQVEVGPTAVKAGEPVTVKMRIAGQGNITQIIPPDLETNHDLKLYDARSAPSKNPGEVRFEQVVIPTSDTVKEIPAISFSYFNTKTSDFRTITKGPFPISVEAIPEQVAQVIATIPSAVMQETEILGRDIVYLKPLPKKWTLADATPWHRSRLFFMLLPIPALLLIIVAFATGRKNRLANNVALARRQQAPKAARRSVQQAEKAMHKKNDEAFYEALWNALADYFGNRLNLPPGDVNLQTVLKRVPKEAEAIEKLFTTIEQRRYGIEAGDGSKHEMKALLKQFNSTLHKCERMKL
ncbi:BatD family protein [Pontiella sulfatireligans]|nr:BatD family protein [Pontiella sulfatireligans]